MSTTFLVNKVFPNTVHLCCLCKLLIWLVSPTEGCMTLEVISLTSLLEVVLVNFIGRGLDRAARWCSWRFLNWAMARWLSTTHSATSGSQTSNTSISISVQVMRCVAAVWQKRIFEECPFWDPFFLSPWPLDYRYEQKWSAAWHNSMEIVGETAACLFSQCWLTAKPLTSLRPLTCPLQWERSGGADVVCCVHLRWVIFIRALSAFTMGQYAC